MGKNVESSCGVFVCFLCVLIFFGGKHLVYPCFFWRKGSGEEVEKMWRVLVGFLCVFCVFCVFLGENTWFIHVFFGEKGVEKKWKKCGEFLCVFCVFCVFFGENTWFIHVFFGEKGVEKKWKKCGEFL